MAFHGGTIYYLHSDHRYGTTSLKLGGGGLNIKYDPIFKRLEGEISGKVGICYNVIIWPTPSTQPVDFIYLNTPLNGVGLNRVEYLLPIQPFRGRWKNG